jgi:hypothetical protein
MMMPPLPAVAAQGFERVEDVRGELAAVESRSPWDGGDGEEVVEEEFDLADLMNEEVEGDQKTEL